MINSGTMVAREQLKRSPAASKPQGERMAKSNKKTHCKRGHLRSDENIYVNPKTGYGDCLPCRRIYAQSVRDEERYGGNREKAIQRDGEQCVKCGMTREEHRDKYDRDIAVDHIDDKGRNSSEKNHAMDNLQTLCIGCHGHKSGLTNNCYKLDAEDVADIRMFYANGMKFAHIAKAYPVAEGQISLVARGLVRKHNL